MGLSPELEPRSPNRYPPKINRRKPFGAGKMSANAENVATEIEIRNYLNIYEFLSLVLVQTLYIKLK